MAQSSSTDEDDKIAENALSKIYSVICRNADNKEIEKLKKEIKKLEKKLEEKKREEKSISKYIVKLESRLHTFRDDEKDLLHYYNLLLGEDKDAITKYINKSRKRCSKFKLLKHYNAEHIENTVELKYQDRLLSLHNNSQITNRFHSYLELESLAYGGMYAKNGDELCLTCCICNSDVRKFTIIDTGYSVILMHAGTTPDCITYIRAERSK